MAVSVVNHICKLSHTVKSWRTREGSWVGAEGGKQTKWAQSAARKRHSGNILIFANKKDTQDGKGQGVAAETGKAVKADVDSHK